MDNPRVQSVMNPDWHYCRRALPACLAAWLPFCLSKAPAVFMLIAASWMPVLEVNAII